MNTNKKRTTLYITMIALFTALTYATTYFVNIPTISIFGSGGNINLGDSIIFISGILLGPLGGAIAGGLGASLADLTSSYVIYAPFTLVIKALAGGLTGFMFHYVLSNNTRTKSKQVLSMLVASLVIVVGYYFAEVIILTIGGALLSTSLLASLLTILPNVLQVSVSIVVAIIVVPRLFTAYSQINNTKALDKAE